MATLETEGMELVHGAAADAPEHAAGRPPVALRDVVAAGLALYAGQLLTSFAPPRMWACGLAVMGAGVLLLALRFRSRGPRRWGPRRWEPRRWGRSAWLDLLQVALGLGACLPLALNPGGLKSQIAPWSMILLWALSCTVVFLAVCNFRPQAVPLRLPAWQRLDRWDALIIVLLAAAALALRAPGVERIPLGFDPDEGSFGHFILDAAAGSARDPFETGWVTHPTLQFFLNSVFVPFTGRTFLTMRLPAVVMGTLAVIAIYLLARALFGRRVALVAGFLAVTSDVAIHFSRLGVNNVSDMLFMAWTLAGLWIGGATGSPLAFALAGLGLGLAQYYYFGARAIPFVVAAQLLAWVLAGRRRALAAAPLLLGMLLVTLVVTEPLIGHWIRTPESAGQRLDLTLPFSGSAEVAARYGLTPARMWWEHARDSLLVLIVQPDRGSFYHANQAMLNPLHVPFFLAGLLVLLARIRRPASQGMLAWLLIVLTLGSFLLTVPATFHRLLGLAPMLIVTTAVGVDGAAEAMAASARRLRSRIRISHALTAIMALLLAAATAYYYFGVYGIYDFRESRLSPNQEAVSIAALEYEAAGGEGAFLLCTQDTVDADGNVGHQAIKYIAGDAFTSCAPGVLAQLGDRRPIAFYFLPDRFDDVPAIMSAWPGGTLKWYYRRADYLHIMTRYTVAAATP